MRLVEDAKRAWRWLSVQAMALAIVILGSWIAMPDDLRSAIPTWAGAIVAITILVLGIVGRLVKQEVKGP